MVNIIEAQKQLELYLLEVEEKYLHSHMGTMESPDDYMFDVRSYCLLCHAAFEEFIESVCISLLHEIYNNYINNQRISYSTMCLLNFEGEAEVLSDDKWANNQKLFDHIRKKLDKIKQTFSIYVMENNHGIGLKYLKKMLIPLGIDIPQDPVQQNSLSQLANYRGGYAHTSKRAASMLSPEDAQKYVYDVYNMMKDVATIARHIHFYSIH